MDGSIRRIILRGDSTRVKRLKELLENVDDNTEIMIRNTVNSFRNVQDLDQVELSSYMFFGKEHECIILNTSNSKEIEENEDEEIKKLKEDKEKLIIQLIEMEELKDENKRLREGLEKLKV